MKQLLAALALAAALPAHAAIHIWTGAAGEKMSDAANWTGGSPAGDSTADLSFPAGVTRLAVVNDLGNLTVRSIAFSGRGYSLSGNAVTVANGEIGDWSGGANTIAIDLVLAGDLSLSVGRGEPDLSHGLTLSGRIRGNGSLLKLGPGHATLAGTSPNTYSGDTRVGEGELRLAKSAGVNAIPGHALAGGSVNGAALVTITNEQIPDSATIAVGRHGELAIGGTETIGPLVLHGSSRVWANIPAALVLGGDLTVHADYFQPVTFFGTLVLPATRVLTAVDPASGRYSLHVNFRATSGSAGLILRGSTSTELFIGGTWEGPTTVEGAYASINNPATAVTLKSGFLEKSSVKSLHAAGGRVGSVTTTGDLRLDAPASVAPSEYRGETVLTAGGAVTIGGATLDIDFRSLTRQLGATHTLLSNSGTKPVTGTFASAPEGTIVAGRARVSYTGGDGNDITLTQAGKYVTTVALNVSNSSPTAGQPVSLTALVSSRESSGPITGTITFRDRTGVLATKTLANDFASLTTVLPLGTSAITATYDGNDLFAGSEATTSIETRAPKPVVASVAPDPVPIGAPAELTIRGENFVEGCRVVIGAYAYTPLFVSSSQLKLRWKVPRYASETVVYLEVSQPGNRPVSSDPFPVRVAGKPAQTSDLTFDSTGVEGHVTRGASSVWFAAVRVGEFGALGGTTMAHDNDDDTKVRVPFPNPLQTDGTFTMVDMTTGTIHAGEPAGTRPVPSPFPGRMFLRDSSGSYSHVVVPNIWNHFVWVRPGVGAWDKLKFEEGEADDLDRVYNEIGVFNTSSMRPIGTSPAPPAGIEPGDVFLGMPWYGETWFGERIDRQLAETDGPGEISFLSAGGLERNGAAVIGLKRLGGSDGTVSVNYATADGTATAGVQYAASAGTVTFAPGEILKWFEIPLINDSAWSGETKFRLTLSQPAGTVIAGPVSADVTIYEDDPMPAVSFASTQMPEGNTAGRTASIDVMLSAAARVPLTMYWWWSDNGSTRTAAALVFQPGETRKTLSVPYDGNSVPDRDRTFRFWIQGYAGQSTDGIVEIIDDDSVNVAVLDASIAENGARAFVPFTLSSTSGKPVVITYRTVDGTARAGADYTAAGGKLAFREHDTVLSIPITIANDFGHEGNEWFTVEITEVSFGVVRRSVAVVSIVDDDPADANTRRRSIRH